MSRQDHASKPLRARRYLVVLAVALASIALSGCFGPGFYSVGQPLTSKQLPPGLWRSLGGNGCSWTRVQPGSVSTAGKSTHTSGPQYASIQPSDIGFATTNCLPFWQEPGAFARPAVQPGSPFGDGDFLVNYEVRPGTYRSSQPCQWAVVSGFRGINSSGNNPDFVRGATSQTATIGAGDYGFTSQGCGQWNFTTSSPPTTTPTTTTRPPTTTTPPPPPDPTFHVASEDFPDPFVLREDNQSRCGGDPAPCYYAYSTEAGFLGLLTVPVIRSTDLVNWKWAGPPASGSTAAGRNAMPTLPSWAVFGGNWAPSVMFNTTLSKYVMYYTAKSTAGSNGGGRECVGVATSTAPDGPYTDSNSQPLTCPAGAGDTIDPSTFVDGTGNLWLLYADQSAIRSRQLTANGLAFVPGSTPQQLLTSTQLWENGRVEAPSMIETPDTGIVHFYSGNVFTSPNYGVSVARCTSASSGCTLISNSPILASSGTTYGPGGQSPFQLPNGSWRMAYHAWDNIVGYDNGGKRTLHIKPMTFSGTSPNQNPTIG